VFRVYSRNVVGLSIASSEVTVRASAIPSKPDAPTTAVSGDNVVITWVKPDNGGSTIASAKILIKEADGDFSEETITCNGADSVILAANSCTVPITTLMAEPFNQPWGSSIYVKVTMTNVVGESLESDEGNGALILTNSDAPVNLANNVAQTDATQIGLTWDESPTNGGAAVEDYRIVYDQGAGTDDYVPLATGVYTRNFIATGLTAGTTYKFKVQGRNTFGYSALSVETSILAAQVPDAPMNLFNQPLVTNSEQVGFEWSAGAFNGGSVVIDYRVSYDQGTGTWLVLDSAVTATNYIATGLSADVVYAFKVESRNLLGYSAESS